MKDKDSLVAFKKTIRKWKLLIAIAKSVKKNL